MPRKRHLACLQTRPRATFGQARDEALTLAQHAVAEGAEMLFLPEYCGGLAVEGRRILAPAAPEEEHPVLEALRSFAREREVWIMAGSVAVPGPDGRIANRGFTIGRDGRIASRYDKIHMFDIQLSESEVYEESASVAPGHRAALVEAEGTLIGHTICYDLRFPHLYRALAKAGAEILAVPAAFTQKTGEAHWHVLNRARAIENGAFVIAPGAHGLVPGGGATYGHSLIVDPWGVVLAHGGEGAGVVTAVIDLDEVAAARRKIPALSHDRPYAAPETARAQAAE